MYFRDEIKSSGKFAILYPYKIGKGGDPGALLEKLTYKIAFLVEEFAVSRMSHLLCKPPIYQVMILSKVHC